MLRVILVVLPFSLDTFALSTILGVLPLTRGQRLRIAIVFAAAEGLMPAVGLVVGLPLGHALGRYASYVAGALLIGIGGWVWRSVSAWMNWRLASPLASLASHLSQSCSSLRCKRCW
jgi:putative Mn2+ efflux pump MntP